MVFSSNKPSKMCPFCKAEIKNLGMHISNKHPSAWSKIDDSPILNGNIEIPPRKEESLNNSITPPVQYRSVSDMVKDKLDTMLNLRLIQMLEAGLPISEVNRIMQPTQPQPQQNGILDELKKYREIQSLFGNKEVIPETDNTGEWLSLANNAIPLIKEMLPNRQESIKHDEFREHKTGDIPTNRDIQQQTAGDTTESGISSKESGITIRAEREDYTITPITDKRTI